MFVFIWVIESTKSKDKTQTTGVVLSERKHLYVPYYFHILLFYMIDVWISICFNRKLLLEFIFSHGYELRTGIQSETSHSHSHIGIQN
jgi:hypothetical protein